MTILGIYSHKGRVKEVNQDACCFMEAQTHVGRCQMGVICDGVGGLAKGELASATVVQRFATWFELQLPSFVKVNGADLDTAFQRLPIARYGNTEIGQIPYSAPRLPGCLSWVVAIS